MAIRSNRLDAAEYERQFADVHPPFDNDDAAQIEANRCLFCYDAPCTKSCPTSIDVAKFIRQIGTGNVRGSAHTILSANILGAGCSRVCPVEKLCEGACVYNLLEEAPIPIARLQRYATEKALEKKWPLFSRQSDTGKKVAVIGAGPAGLSCAHALSRTGVQVDVFEKEAKGGGLMTYGIAAYKVTPEFCEQELDYILSIGGIDVKYQHALGEQVQLDELKAQYDAVYLAFGVGLTQGLNIPGEEAEGVVDAIDFIYTLRDQGYAAVPVGDRVAVIGMGMTAIDAATQARRLGAGEVTLLYRRTREEMPCTEHELELAMLDGCRVEWLASPSAVQVKDGRVCGLQVERMQLAEPGQDGRRQPKGTGEFFKLDVDMVIKATGQQPYLTLVEAGRIEHQRGKVTVRDKAVSNLPGVFAGGDCVNGGKEVVDAVQAGKDGAAAVLRYLGLSTE